MHIRAKIEYTYILTTLRHWLRNTLLCCQGNNGARSIVICLLKGGETSAWPDA